GSEEQREEKPSAQARHDRVPPAPAPSLLWLPDGPGVNRLPLEEAPQVMGKFQGRRVTPRWLLGQSLQADRLQVARKFVIDPPRGPRLLVQHLVQQHRLRAPER